MLYIYTLKYTVYDCILCFMVSIIYPHKDQDYMWSSPVLGAQRGLPVAVVTNIPAMPMIVYAFLLKQRRPVFRAREPGNY